jgi:hypothetical protein
MDEFRGSPQFILIARWVLEFLQEQFFSLICPASGNTPHPSRHLPLSKLSAVFSVFDWR